MQKYAPAARAKTNAATSNQIQRGILLRLELPDSTVVVVVVFVVMVVMAVGTKTVGTGVATGVGAIVGVMVGSTGGTAVVVNIGAVIGVQNPARFEEHGLTVQP